MITGPLITENPFGVAGIIWREAGFAVTDAAALHLDGLSVTLPTSLRDAVAKRRSEYLAGRLCAALALRSAGLPETVGQAGRAPVWPTGAVGSISHSDTRVVAVVSRGHAGLGVDVEPLMTAAAADDIRALILTPAEAALRPAGLTVLAFLTLVFSAKEALYKALSGQLARMPAFLDVVVLELTATKLRLWLGDGSFWAHYRVTEADVLTLVVVDHQARPTAETP